MARPQQTNQLVRKTVALVLAGGRGSRLKQLTGRRAKPAVFFGGKFRIKRRITRFDEKPAEPMAMTDSHHDFGADVIPRVVAEGQAHAHPFSLSCVTSNSEAADCWRAVGTLDASNAPQ